MSPQTFCHITSGICTQNPKQKKTIYYKFKVLPQTQTADLQTGKANIVVKCLNRFPIPKLDFWIGNDSQQWLPRLPCHFASLQSAFVAQRFTIHRYHMKSMQVSDIRGGLRTTFYLLQLPTFQVNCG